MYTKHPLPQKFIYFVRTAEDSALMPLPPLMRIMKASKTFFPVYLWKWPEQDARLEQEKTSVTKGKTTDGILGRHPDDHATSPDTHKTKVTQSYYPVTHVPLTPLSLSPVCAKIVARKNVYSCARHCFSLWLMVQLIAPTKPRPVIRGIGRIPRMLDVITLEWKTQSPQTFRFSCRIKPAPPTRMDVLGRPQWGRGDKCCRECKFGLEIPLLGNLDRNCGKHETHASQWDKEKKKSACCFEKYTSLEPGWPRMRPTWTIFWGTNLNEGVKHMPFEIFFNHTLAYPV